MNCTTDNRLKKAVFDAAKKLGFSGEEIEVATKTERLPVMDIAADVFHLLPKRLRRYPNAWELCDDAAVAIKKEQRALAAEGGAV